MDNNLEDLEYYENIIHHAISTSRRQGRTTYKLKQAVFVLLNRKNVIFYVPDYYSVDLLRKECLALILKYIDEFYFFNKKDDDTFKVYRDSIYFMGYRIEFVPVQNRNTASIKGMSGNYTEFYDETVIEKEIISSLKHIREKYKTKRLNIDSIQ